MVSADGSFELLQPQKEKMMIIGTFQISVARIEATGPPRWRRNHLFRSQTRPQASKSFLQTALKSS